MKKALLALTLILASGIAMAQDNWFFPAAGKANSYKTTASTIAGSQTLYSTIYTSAADAASVTVTTDIFTSADAATPTQSTSMKYTVTDEAYTLNFADALASTLGSMENVNVTESSGEMIYPKNPEQGKSYGTATLKFAASMMGTEIGVEAQIKDRAVTATETIEVPAGKFECMKFEETTEVKMMGQTIQTKTTSWISRGVGVVKQTTDSMNGMLTTTMELSAVKDK